MCSQRECGEKGVGRSQALEGPHEVQEREESPSKEPRTRSPQRTRNSAEKGKRPHCQGEPGVQMRMAAKMIPDNSVTPFVH